ncbi:MAG: hypothetical protein GC193_14360 [Cryomorphaceae bacterium]|nr:hypothetical protein [Cryomorphaceae bacterium]
MSKFLENRLMEEFKNRDYFTRDELFEFYRFFEPDLKEGTFGWRIYDLKDKNIIKSIKRGLYVISYKAEYIPKVSPELIKLAKRITEKFVDAKYCIWETEWLNEFSQHQASRRIILIEIEKYFMESLFYELKDSSRKEIFLSPDQKTIDFYVTESNYPVVVMNLITRSPIDSRTEERVKFHVPLLEKILVDLFAEEGLFYYLKGSELVHIYENSIRNYAINFTTLFSYARRREREKEIKQFLANHMHHLVKDIIE